MRTFWTTYLHPLVYVDIECPPAKDGLRRWVRARTHAICGRACACVRLVFGCAMCDRTFAHFLELNDQMSCHGYKKYSKTSYPILEHPKIILQPFYSVLDPFLFQNVLSCFRTSIVRHRPGLFCLVRKIDNTSSHVQCQSRTS